MGISGLNEYIKNVNENCMERILEYRDLQQLKNTKIGVDFMLWYYNTIIGIAKKINYDYETTHKQIEENPLFKKELYKSFINYNIYFLKKKILPVWVLDSVDKKYKEMTAKKRKEKKKIINEKIEEKTKQLEETEPFENFLLKEEIKRTKNYLFFTSPTFTNEFIDNIKQFATVIQSEGEGETLAATLAKDKHLIGVITKDSDVYPIGTPACFILKNKKIHISLTNCILKSLNMNQDSFRNFCILLGSDFNNRIKGLGPVNAHRLINKYGNIENFINSNEEDEFKKYKNEEDETYLNFKNNYKTALELLSPIKYDHDIINKLVIRDDYENIINVLKYIGVDELDIGDYVYILKNF